MNRISKLKGNGMIRATQTTGSAETLADLLDQLGSIPLERIRLHPPPGTATEADVLARPDGVKRLCELVDGVLVEKPMGYFESRLAVVLIYLLERFQERNELGIVLGADATLRLAPGLVRLPDVAFVSWTHFPNRLLPKADVPDLAPDLAVEVLSPSNTKKEIARKRREYFAAGTTLVWEVDPDARTVTAYTSADQSVVLDESQTLDGAPVLPGFILPIREWFDRAGKRQG
jgi:Uma2 family endonuclease